MNILSSAKSSADTTHLHQQIKENDSVIFDIIQNIIIVVSCLIICHCNDSICSDLFTTTTRASVATKANCEPSFACQKRGGKEYPKFKKKRKKKKKFPQKPTKVEESRKTAAQRKKNGKNSKRKKKDRKKVKKRKKGEKEIKRGEKEKRRRGKKRTERKKEEKKKQSP